MTGLPQTVLDKLATSPVTANRSDFDSPQSNFGNWLTGGTDTSGIRVNEFTAFNFSALYRAVSLISSAICQLPLPVYRRIGERERERVRSHPVAKLLNRRPNSEMNSMTLREVMQSHVLTWGNAYAEIVRDGRGRPTELWPITPDKVMPDRRAGALGYQVTSTNFNAWIPADQMLHIRGLGFDGLIGYSVVRFARESIGMSLAAEYAGSAFFGNSSRPSGVLEHPGTLSEAAGNRLRSRFEEVHRGPKNAGKVMLLEEGVSWKSLGIPPADAQFLETRLFQVGEIARWFGVPPHLLADLSRATFSNIEHQSIEFLQFCLGYWLKKWETEIQDKLFAEEEQDDYYAEHLAEAYLRTDTMTRYQSYAIARNNGWMSANDVRRAENQSPIGEQGDVYLIPSNMVSAKGAIGTPPAPTPTGPAPQPTPPPPGQSRGLAVESICDNLRPVLLADYQRMARKFAASVMTAAKNPTRFLAKVEESAEHHAELVPPIYARILETAAKLAESTADAQKSSTELAKSQFSRYFDDVLELTGRVSQDQLIPELEKLGEKWISNTESEAANAMANYARILADSRLPIQHGSGS